MSDPEKKTILESLTEKAKNEPPKKFGLSNELRGVLGCLVENVMATKSFNDEKFNLYEWPNPVDHASQLLTAQRVYIFSQISSMPQEKKDEVQAVYVIINEASNSIFMKERLNHLSSNCVTLIYLMLKPAEEHLNPTLKSLMKACHEKQTSEASLLSQALDEAIGQLARELCNSNDPEILDFIRQLDLS